ncbi:unnamed protein product, partial [Heterotrigona itama]
YGRTCKDIGCRRDEVCVMAEDPCSIYQRDNCGRYPTCAKAHPGVYPTRTAGKIRPTPPPTPPPRSSSFNGYGGRVSGNSGSRNTIGNGSIFSRLFGNDRYGATTPRSRAHQGASGYYDSHTSVDDQGNRIWRFSG